MLDHLKNDIKSCTSRPQENLIKKCLGLVRDFCWGFLVEFWGFLLGFLLRIFVGDFCRFWGFLSVLGIFGKNATKLQKS